MYLILYPSLFVSLSSTFAFSLFFLLASMVSSICWNDQYNMLATTQDRHLVVWYHPAVVFTDKDLLHRTSFDKQKRFYACNIHCTCTSVYQIVGQIHCNCIPTHLISMIVSRYIVHVFAMVFIWMYLYMYYLSIPTHTVATKRIPI